MKKKITGFVAAALLATAGIAVATPAHAQLVKLRKAACYVYPLSSSNPSRAIAYATVGGILDVVTWTLEAWSPRVGNYVMYQKSSTKEIDNRGDFLRRRVNAGDADGYCFGLGIDMLGGQDSGKRLKFGQFI